MKRRSKKLEHMLSDRPIHLLGLLMITLVTINVIQIEKLKQYLLSNLQGTMLIDYAVLNDE